MTDQIEIIEFILKTWIQFISKYPEFKHQRIWTFPSYKEFFFKHKFSIKRKNPDILVKQIYHILKTEHTQIEEDFILLKNRVLKKIEHYNYENEVQYTLEYLNDKVLLYKENCDYESEKQYTLEF